jgi:hypothetical protein
LENCNYVGLELIKNWETSNWRKYTFKTTQEKVFKLRGLQKQNKNLWKDSKILFVEVELGWPSLVSF